MTAVFWYLVFVVAQIGLENLTMLDRSSGLTELLSTIPVRNFNNITILESDWLSAHLIFHQIDQ